VSPYSLTIASTVRAKFILTAPSPSARIDGSCLPPQDHGNRSARSGLSQVEWAAMRAVSELLGIGTTETVRKWVRQAEVDDGSRPGVSSEESAELKRLKRENAELKRANGILKAASAFFAAELDRPQH
jgi:transposase